MSSRKDVAQEIKGDAKKVGKSSLYLLARDLFLKFWNVFVKTFPASYTKKNLILG